MKLEIVRHRKSTRDVLEIFLQIGNDNVDAAERFLTSINQDLHHLAEMPGMGAIREFEDPRLKDLRS